MPQLNTLGCLGGEFLVWAISWTHSWHVPDARRSQGVTRERRGGSSGLLVPDCRGELYNIPLKYLS